LMKRALLVLALAVCSSAGCRSVYTQGGCGCGDSCELGGSSCGQPVGCCDSCGSAPCDGTGASCPLSAALCNGACGGQCFGRFCSNTGCGVPGVHDCSACDSPGWGCPGYGYCQNTCRGMCRGLGPMLRNGYCGCCGQPGPSCCCSSGDHNYDFAPGPPVGQTAYPYYTVRGPRDFLLGNPPKLGPH
jgi:hypothetical protein